MTDRSVLTLVIAVAALAAMPGAAPAQFLPFEQHLVPSKTPPFEQHYAPVEDLEALDVAEIDQADTTIDIAAYVLTDVPVIEALTNAALRGVRVRVYRWREEHSPSGATAQALVDLRAAGAAERFKTPDAPLMHLKSYCIDSGLLRFGPPISPAAA